MTSFIQEFSGLFTVFLILLVIIVGVVAVVRQLLPTTKPSSFGNWKSDTSSHTLSAEAGHHNAATTVHNVPKSAEQLHDDKRQYLKERRSK